MIVNKKYWLFQFGGWGAFFLMHLFFAWLYGKFDTISDRQLFLYRDLGFVVIGFILTHIMRLVIIKGNILAKRLQQQIGYFLLITIIVACVAGSIEFGIFNKLHLTTPREAESIARRGLSLIILSNAMSWFIYLFIWNLIYLIYHIISHNQKQQIDTLQLQSLVKELELKTIKSHINPHFIFNALNSIRAMVDENPTRARNAITELSNILRSSINLDKTETVSLKDELEIVTDYLALEQMRFEDRLHVIYDIQEETLTEQVPPMMLQTLTENAIKHGIGQQIKGGTITVASNLQDGLLELSVENTGELKQSDKGSGFGIKSINERLQLLYGSKGNFEIRQVKPKLVQATVHIPVTL